jgi:hypothetical protein
VIVILIWDTSVSFDLVSWDESGYKTYGWRGCSGYGLISSNGANVMVRLVFGI